MSVAKHTLKLTTTLLLATVGLTLLTTSAAQARLSRLEERTFGSMVLPTGLTVDQTTGNIYAVDGRASKIFVFGPNGEAPLGGGPPSLNGGETPDKEFNFATEAVGIAAANGELFVPDVKKNKVVKLRLNDTSHLYEYVCEITAYNGSGVACTSSGTTGGSGLGSPLGATVDSGGNLYISNYGSQSIYEFNPSGEQIKSFSTPVLPQYIAVTDSGTIYAQEYGQGGSPGQVYKLARSSQTGEIEGTPEVIPTPATGIAYDRASEHLILDLGSELEELDAEGKIVLRFGGEMVSESGAVAIDEATNHVYVLNHIYVLNEGEVVEYGLPVPVELGPPRVNDQSPSVSGITRTRAVLKGTVDAEGQNTTYRFVYGITDTYGSSTQSVSAGSSIMDKEVGPVQITELQPHTIYHYALVATSPAGTVTGLDQTLTTSSLTPPIATTGGASGVSQAAATITGTIDTRGLRTTYGFQVAPVGTAYGPAMGLGGIGAGPSEASVAVALGALQPGTTYHYRITATNADGTVYGLDQVFATPPFTSGFVTPPAPLPFVAVPSIAFPGEAKTTVVKTKVKTKAKAKKSKKKPKAKQRRRVKQKRKKK